MQTWSVSVSGNRISSIYSHRDVSGASQGCSSQQVTSAWGQFLAAAAPGPLDQGTGREAAGSRARGVPGGQAAREAVAQRYQFPEVAWQRRRQVEAAQ